MTIKLKVLKVTARDPQVIDEDGDRADPYTFAALELPSGECVVLYESTNDGWFASRADIEACGCDVIEGVEETGEARAWTEADLKKSVAGSAGEFGRAAVPESLHRFVA